MTKLTRQLASPGRPGIPEKTKDAVINAFNNGENCTAITQRFRISKSSFYRIIKQEEHR